MKLASNGEDLQIYGKHRNLYFGPASVWSNWAILIWPEFHSSPGNHIWFRILNSCYCFLRAGAVEKIKTSIRNSTRPNRCATKDIKPNDQNLWSCCFFRNSKKEDEFKKSCRNFKKNCGECYEHKWNFKPKFSSIFHFWLVNDGWISHILYVKLYCQEIKNSYIFHVWLV